MENINEKTANAVEIDEAELAAAEEEALESEGVYVHEFTKPFTYEGKTYESLTFDFGSLTGNDSVAIETEMMVLGKTLVAAQFSGEFQSRMAARACREKVGLNVLRALPITHYQKILGKARSFLMSAEL